MIGVWLIQLGTPEAPTRSAVKNYLDEFLMDPRMIELPTPMRAMLVKGLITPFRSSKTAEAYQKVWMPKGSPLLVYSQSFANKLQEVLGTKDYFVQLGMRYGKPSIETCWKTFRKMDLERIIVLPLFPQYSSATTASVYDKINEISSKDTNIPALEYIPAFYKQPSFIEAFAERARECQIESYEHVLFSFHGIPERFVLRSHSQCRIAECCEQESVPSFCYRAHCIQTAEGIRKRLGLAKEKTSVSFQSRLGREKWLDPYTDFVIPDLAKKGIKKLAVFSPSFVADCLETLEEINIRAREDFIKASGKDFLLVPSLNDSETWVKAVADWIRPTSFEQNTDFVKSSHRPI